MSQNDAKEEPLQGFSPEGLYKFWAETLKLPTIGPMFAFSKEFSNYSNDIVILARSCPTSRFRTTATGP